MVNHRFNLLYSAQEILVPQNILDAQLFDSYGKMLENRRQSLGELAEIFMQNSVRFPEAEIKDIVLSGSKAGYYYNEKEFYDIGVIINFDKCPGLKPQIEAQNKYLFLMRNLSGKKYNFQLNGCRINLYAAAEYPDDYCFYSILKNEWIRHPVINKNLKAKDLINEYYSQNIKFYQFLNTLPLENNEYSFENCLKMFDYIKELRSMKATLPGFLCYQLLTQSGCFSDFIVSIRSNYTISLSTLPDFHKP